jgi:energy-coupling factor transporter ATP-binding protein EcfA2
MREAVRAQEKVTFIGPNGTGKSHLALGYCACMPSAIVHDPKHEIELDGFVTSSDEAVLLTEPRVIWRPPLLADPIAVGDVAGYAALKRQHTCLYLDEAAYVSTASRIGRWLSAAIRMGRSAGVGIWGATQRPKDVSNLFFSEAWVIICSPWVVGFDQEKIRGFVGEDFRSIVTKSWPEYTFYMVRRGEKTGRMIRAH